MLKEINNTISLSNFQDVVNVSVTNSDEELEDVLVDFMASNLSALSELDFNFNQLGVTVNKIMKRIAKNTCKRALEAFQVKLVTTDFDEFNFLLDFCCEAANHCTRFFLNNQRLQLLSRV
jgi:predicted DNA-binding ArsR family transcriptional regulator